MKNKKIVLVLPNERWGGKRPWGSIPHTALILTALIKPDFDFSIIDANGPDLTEDECRKRLKEKDPDVVLVSAISSEYFQQYHAAIAMAKEISPDIKTVMGGVYPTVLPEETLNDEKVDYIFQGHAEERVVPFLEAVIDQDQAYLQDCPGIGFCDENGRKKVNPVTTYISDVKELVEPDYSELDIVPYFQDLSSRSYQHHSNDRTAHITTSYGCPYNCTFCASRTISGKKTVYRPLDDVLDEVDFLYNQHQVRHLVFLDDNMIADRSRIEEMLHAFIKRFPELTWKPVTVAAWHLDEDLIALMKRSGCSQITISVESGSQRVLREVIKKPLKLDIIPPVVEICHRHEMDIAANFVIGMPGETWDDLRETFRFAEKGDFDIVHFHIATPLPQTELYDKAKENGYLPEDFHFLDPNYFGFGKAFIATEEFTPSELMILRAFEWDRINFSTPEKTRKVAEMYMMSVEELNEHRRQTRRNLGIHF